jgi:outer membrane protein assembly factor BamE (lipoprotein component of BamABCDE complex)
MARPRILPTFAIALLATLVVLASGCASPPPAEQADELTVGKVQGEIKVGMSAAAVAEILGSPNIVTTDEQRREVWIYDKVSTDRVDTSSGIGGTIIILGGSSSRSTSSRTQRTLTIIIKYDEEKKVRDFAYNYSQF